MRVVGPNCLGVVNTAVGTALQATLAEPMPPGDIGVATQSGGVAIALAEGLGSLGLGVSSLLSIGDGLDVAGEDALLWWSQDGRTRAGVLYLDSLPDPELFAVVATRLAGAIPLLAVSSGASDPGARAAAWHNAAIDGRDGGARLRNAVFEQAGILTVQSLDQLCEALALLRWQHLPTGPRVGIVTNAGGAAVLAADACARHGLLVPGLSPETQQDLRGALPKLATIANPVDTSAPVSPATFAAAVDALAGDPAIDAILALSVRTALGNPLDGLTVLDRQWPRPVLAVRLGQTAQVQPLRPQLSNPPTGAQIPTYADADAAARALALAWRRARWLDSPAR
jgi:acyl-CoA synthetase (NDP forming)